jgi:hypothetical protein
MHAHTHHSGYNIRWEIIASGTVGFGIVDLCTNMYAILYYVTIIVWRNLIREDDTWDVHE